MSRAEERCGVAVRVSKPRRVQLTRLQLRAREHRLEQRDCAGPRARGRSVRPSPVTARIACCASRDFAARSRAGPKSEKRIEWR